MTYQNIDIDTYNEQFDDADYTLVDVREIEEYQDGRIPGAVNIPLSLLQMRLDEIPREKPVVLVCARGGRSAMAAEFMVSAGYDELYNLEDGTLGWQMRGLPFEYDD